MAIQGPEMKNRTQDPLRAGGWCLDATTDDIVQMVLEALTGDQKSVLHWVAADANSQI